MGQYVVDNDRLIKKTPDKIIEDGKPVYGSFDKSFKLLNLIELKNRCKFINKKRLTEWEAFELNCDDFTLVSAVYNNVTLNGMGILVLYDKKEDKIYSYKIMTYYKTCHIGDNLINSKTFVKTKKFTLEIYNDFENKKAKIIANIYNKKNGSFKMNIDINMFAPSSVVSIPLGKDKPLYSEKAIFIANGTLTFKNKEHIIKNATAIIDDHKGYYPYKAHYDWLTTMGKISIDGQEKFFGFNLTKNQSINEEKYNENNIWIEDNFYYLPPVKFTHEGNKWIIKDEYGLVDLEFNIKQTFKMMMPLLFIDVKYYLPFGILKGYVKNSEGKTFIVDNLIGIAEDKTTRI